MQRGAGSTIRPFCYDRKLSYHVVPANAGTTISLRRRLLLRREAAVEGFALGGHLLEQLWRGEAGAVFGLELVAEFDELPGTHEVDIGQRAAGERREAKPQDRADIGLARI